MLWHKSDKHDQPTPPKEQPAVTSPTNRRMPLNEFELMMFKHNREHNLGPNSFANDYLWLTGQ